MRRDLSKLCEFLPDLSCPLILQWFDEHPVSLAVVKPRRTKLGDFRPPFQGKPARISINNNLNPYSFLITLVHEMAHYTVFKVYGKGIKPHGSEWKNEYKRAILPFYNLDIFPDDIKNALNRYFVNPKASTCTDASLYTTLMRYDEGEAPILLADLPEGSAFSLSNGRRFVKGKKRRTRFICKDLNNKREYLINQLIHVKPNP